MHRYCNQKPYSSSAGPWPVQFSEEQIQSQRDAGSKLLTEWEQALANGETSLDIQGGIYRIASSLNAVGIENLSVSAANVEIIMEAEQLCAHFRILDCKGVKIRGPLILDGSPFGFSQGEILESDGCSYIDMEPHPGYPFPIAGHRTTCFNPETGVMIARYQDVVQQVEKRSKDRIRLTFDETFFKFYEKETAKAISPGNLICLENSENMRGGFELRNTTGIELVDVSMHTFALTWGLPLHGDIRLIRFTGCRRPCTNRLMGGGFFAFGMFGGNVHIEDCELGHNFDDITDIGSELGFAFKQVAPNQVYAGFTSSEIQPGKQLVFYAAYTMQETGRATVVESTKTEDRGITEEFWETLKKASVLTWDCVPFLLTLDRDIKISELEILDCCQARPKSLTVINSYFHDSLAAGISLKGANKVHVCGNVVERAGYRAIGVGFDPYWWEGGVPSNITIEDNHIIDTPYNLPDLTPAINIYVDAAPAMLAKATGTPIHNVSVCNNTIINAKTAAIGVAYTRNARVVGNRVENPVAAGLQTAWGRAQNYDHPCAIWLDSVEDVTVEGNFIDVGNPQLFPDVIKPSSKTDTQQIRLNSNFLTTQGSSPAKLPDNFFGGKVSSSSSKVVERRGDGWQERHMPGCFSGRFQESCTPGDTISFKWHGCRARLYGVLRRSYGRADVYLDGHLCRSLDASRLPAEFAALIHEEGLPGQLLCTLGPVDAGDHELSVVVGDRFAPDAGLGIGIEAFDCLDSDVQPHVRLPVVQ